MPMTLVFKRAKCFVTASDNDNGTKKFLAQANPAGPVPVPFWVADTSTFKQGIKDGSIVNLTPPHQMPGYKAPLPEPADELEPEPAVDEEEIEQKEVPQAPFGGQPMTPVQPAARVGNVRSGGGRGGK